MRPTEAQLNFIKTIEDFVNERFEGNTKEEAQQYIERNIEEYKLSCNRWSTENGY